MYAVDGKIGSQFFFTFNDCSWVDGKHSVFGKIVQDMSILDDLEKSKYIQVTSLHHERLAEKTS